MNQNLLDNPRAIPNQPDSASDEQINRRSVVTENEWNEIEKVLNILNRLLVGKNVTNKPINPILSEVQSCKRPDELTVFVKKIFPSITRNLPGTRFLTHLVSEKYTALGVAPAWRGYPLPEITDSKVIGQIDSTVQSDLRIIDLQWLHANSKGDESLWQDSNNDDYRELMEKEVFDYVLAHKLAIAITDRDESISELGLCEDMQRDLVAYKTLEIEREQKKIISQRPEVEKDLRIAADIYPRMGKKLLAVMPDRLDQWVSTQVTQSKSKTVWYETYKKITGSSITASSYNAKLQSLKNALRHAHSKFMFH